MKNNWIILSAVVIAVIAFLDMRDRFAELDAVAATTNVQVEMKDAIPRSSGSGVQQKVNTIEKQMMLDDKKMQQKINENTMRIKPNLDPKVTVPSALQGPSTPPPPLH